jgi:hypothetical protein
MEPTFFALLVCLGGLLAWGSGVLYVLMVCCLFGGGAAIALPALGGATITPAVFFLPFLLARALAERGVSGFVSQVAFPSAGFWLLLLTAWSLLATYFLPRIFAGHVLISTIDRDVISSAVQLVALHPVSGNLTQSGYALGGVCAFVAAGALLAGKRRLEHFRNAVLLLAALNCLAAAINWGELYLGLPSMLEYVRNAGYAILAGGELAGLQRISGTFPEASAFSGFTLPLFAFTLSLWLSNVKPAYSGALALASLAFLLFSTSTTAYVGLAIYLTCVGLILAWRGLANGRIPQMGPLMLVGLFGLVALCSVVLFEPELVHRVANFFDVTVVNKLQSDSGISRSSWNHQAWLNFLETYGVGVGLGSARASSYPLVLLSNIGAVGTLLFLVFVFHVFRGVQPEPDLPAAETQRAARHAVLATLIGASVSATVFDLGVAFYAFAAAAVAQPISELVVAKRHVYA